MARTYQVPRYNFGELFVQSVMQRRQDEESRAAREALDAYRMRALNEQIRSAQANEAIARQLQALREREFSEVTLPGSQASIGLTEAQTEAARQQAAFNEQLNPIRLRQAQTEADAAALGLDLERRFGAADREANIAYRRALGASAAREARGADPSLVPFLRAALDEIDTQLNTLSPDEDPDGAVRAGLLRQRAEILGSIITAGQRGTDISSIMDLYNRAAAGGEEGTPSSASTSPAAESESDASLLGSLPPVYEWDKGFVDRAASFLGERVRDVARNVSNWGDVLSSAQIPSGTSIPSISFEPPAEPLIDPDTGEPYPTYMGGTPFDSPLGFFGPVGLLGALFGRGRTFYPQPGAPRLPAGGPAQLPPAPPPRLPGSTVAPGLPAGAPPPGSLPPTSAPTLLPPRGPIITPPPSSPPPRLLPPGPPPGRAQTLKEAFRRAIEAGY